MDPGPTFSGVNGLHIRRFDATSARGPAAYEVHVAFACERWMARIVTLPDRIWRDPDGRHLLIFSAATREEVEAAAFAYLFRACDLRGERIRGLNHDACAGLDQFPARRIVAMYPLQYHLRGVLRPGPSRAIEKTFTANLSESGLFIVTGRALPRGALVSVRLELPGLTEKMEGQIVWTRPSTDSGRPPGVGVELDDPSLTYRARLQSLR